MKKIVLTVGLFFSINGNAVIDEATYRLPDQQVLKDRLEKNGWNHFVEKTKIDELLANKELVPLGVVTAFVISLHDYCASMKENPEVCIMMDMQSKAIISTILQDHPSAMKELEETGVFK